MDLDILLEIPELQRLKNISLSCVPPKFFPEELQDISTRYEHSIGVYKLSKCFCKNNEKFRKYENILYIASLFHDVGTPPFAHISEIFQKIILGKNHEESSYDILKKYTDIFEKSKVSSKEIYNVIIGKGRIGFVLNSKEGIDLDNIDNTWRFVIYGKIREFLKENIEIYNPFEVVSSLEVYNNSLRIKNKEIMDKWIKTREWFYNKFIYGNLNLSIASAMKRALYFTYLNKELNKTFFTLTNDEAIDYILSCNKISSTIFERLINKEKYIPVLNINVEKRRVLRILHPNTMEKFANKICSKFSLNLEDICIFVERNKSYKKNLINKDHYIFAIFVYQNESEKVQKIKDYIRPIIDKI